MNLPIEVIVNHIVPNLDLKTLNSLHTASKDLKYYIDSNYYARGPVEKLFNDRFGALTAEERSISSINQIASQYRSLQNLKPDPHASRILTFTNGKPELITVPTYFQKDSWWGKLKKKYELYRNGASEETCQKINAIFKKQAQIVQELLSTSYDTHCPAQEMRNRIIRIENIEKERNILLEALNYSLDSLTLIERIVFAIINFFHSLWEPANPIQNQLTNNPLPVKSVDFVETKGPIQLAQTEITLNGEAIPLTITLSPGYSFNDPENYFKRTGHTGSYQIQIIRSDSNEIVGNISLDKAWNDGKETTFPNNSLNSVTGAGYSESYYYKPAEGNTYSNPFFHVKVRFDYNPQDNKTGDYPILKLTTQLLMELLKLEPVNHLMIESHVDQSELYAMGGFYSTSIYSDDVFNPQASCDYMEKIHKDVLDYRNTHQKLYKETDYNSPFDVFIDKKEQPINGTQIFHMTLEGASEPVSVEFDLEGTKRIWEEQIEQNRILKDAKGPVLWKFWKTDLSKSAVDQ